MREEPTGQLLLFAPKKWKVSTEFPAPLSLTLAQTGHLPGMHLESINDLPKETPTWLLHSTIIPKYKIYDLILELISTRASGTDPTVEEF